MNLVRLCVMWFIHTQCLNRDEIGNIDVKQDIKRHQCIHGSSCCVAPSWREDGAQGSARLNNADHVTLLLVRFIFSPSPKHSGLFLWVCWFSCSDTALSPHGLWAVMENRNEGSVCRNRILILIKNNYPRFLFYTTNYQRNVRMHTWLLVCPSNISCLLNV